MACHALPRWTNRWQFHFESDSLLTLHGLAICILSYMRECHRRLQYHILIVRWPRAGATSGVLQFTSESHRQPAKAIRSYEHREQSDKEPCKMHRRRWVIYLSASC